MSHRGKKKLPGITDTASQSAEDAFQELADEVNVEIAKFVGNKLQRVLQERELPDDGSGTGPAVVAFIAAMVSSAGRLCAACEPSLDGDVLAATVFDQFNAGRADQMKLPDGVSLQ